VLGLHRHLESRKDYCHGQLVEREGVRRAKKGPVAQELSKCMSKDAQTSSTKADGVEHHCSRLGRPQLRTF